MNLFDLPPLAALLDLAYRGLTALSDALAPIAGSGSAAAAIVLVTLAVRTALLPTAVAAVRAEQVRARLAPRLAELRRRHHRDPERLQRETLRLYRDAGASPFAGMVPLLAQAPVVGLLYAVFLHPTIAGHANALLTATLCGVPLGHSAVAAVAAGMPDPVSLAVFGAVVVLIALVGEASRRVFRPEPGSLPGPAAALAGAAPFVPAAVAVFVPLAAGLYLLVTVAFTLAQRLVLRRTVT